MAGFGRILSGSFESLRSVTSLHLLIALQALFVTVGIAYLEFSVSWTDALVAIVVAVTAGGATQTKPVLSGHSYHSQNADYLLFGLGASDSASVRVRWPSGRESVVSDVAARSTITVREVE